jgi:AmmeMemoRadiSam system protein A
MPDTAELGPILLAHARAAIATQLGLPAPETIDHPALHEPGASFVTLTRQGQLRGCIGHLKPVQPLGRDIHENALAAAFHDPRFAPIKAAEWPDIKIEVSLLGPTTFSHCPTEEDCLRQIVPFKDGVILISGSRHATFLPQVWEQLPDPQEFLTHLLQKTGCQWLCGPQTCSLGAIRYRNSRNRHEPPRPLVAHDGRRPHPVRPVPARLPFA